MSTDYANSLYNNLKSFIDVLRTRVTALETRIITNYGVVESITYSMGAILADPSANFLVDRIVTGNSFKLYLGRTTNKYPIATPPNGSTAYLITSEGPNSYNLYSIIKNSSGKWEYYPIAFNVAKTTVQ